MYALVFLRSSFMINYSAQSTVIHHWVRAAARRSGKRNEEKGIVRRF